MPFSRSLILWTSVLILGGCGDASGPEPTPTSVVIVTHAPSHATAGVALATSPTFVVKDQNGNGLGGVPVSVVVSAGGGTLINAPTVTADGPTVVGQWTLGRTVAANSLTITVEGISPVTFTVTSLAGPLERISIVTGDGQTALAGTSPSAPIRLSPADQYGNALDNQTATFAIGGGGGVVTETTAQSGSDGLITAPPWTLGKSAVPQQLIATVGGRTVTINATVQTNYVIEVRFWGSPMTAEQQALFTTAAARIRGIVVGAVPPDVAANADVATDCGVDGVPPLNETILGLLIYASIQDIDGKGRILARAGPCYVRSTSDLRTVVGVMEFDAADINSLAAEGSLVDVIMHEMLHVVGVGTFWDDKGLLRNVNTATVEYVGAGGLEGCRQTGGTTSCASAVPVENTGGPGTFNSHWRESVFANELMTGYINAGPMPLSVITVRSIEDLGYTVNPPAADAYFIAAGSLHQSGEAALTTPVGVEWERGLATGPFVLPRHRPSAARTSR
ncbi:MAG: leishmanolysin-related zinc metalloendopeptidase [Gemmatimonadaceae bacterium]